MYAGAGCAGATVGQVGYCEVWRWKGTGKYDGAAAAAVAG